LAVPAMGIARMGTVYPTAEMDLRDGQHSEIGFATNIVVGVYGRLVRWACV